MESAGQGSGYRGLLLAWPIMVFLCGGSLGCGGRGPAEPEAKVRLTRLLRLYQVYVARNHHGPPDEQALRAFGQKLSAKERDESLIGDDPDGLFTSPRDHEKYVIRYNLKLEPSGPTRAVAWEAAGQGGKRFVALSIGYVEEYDDQTLRQYQK
jgi:hypothetical protein